MEDRIAVLEKKVKSLEDRLSKLEKRAKANEAIYQI